MPAERGSNGATTSINQSGGITSSAISVTVAASTSAGFPDLTATPGQFRVQVEQELWLVTATSGTDGVNWTITRHIEGTTAASHVNGSQVVQTLTWAALENLAASGGTPAASAVAFTPAGGIAATDVQAALQEVDTEKAPKASPTFTGVVTTPALAVSGLTGSLSASRYVGATASGAPTTGAHLVGDWCWALDGALWLCTANGTPGTWAQVSGGTPTSIANAGGSVVVNGSGNVIGTSAGGGAVVAVGGGAAISNASWGEVGVAADDSITMFGGPTGGAHVDIHANGDVLLQPVSGQSLKLLNVPTSDPSVSDAMWLDGGVLVKSGSTAPSGGGGMSSFTLAGDGGSSQTINDGNTLTVAGGVGLVSAAGATDTVTVDLDINSLTADASPDGAADYVATWDASASAHKKVLLNNLPGGAPFAGALVSHSANQSITSASFTTLGFNGEVFDTDAFHDNATNNSRLTVPTGKDGYYLVGFDGWFDTNASDVRFVRLLKNGTTELARDGKAGISGNGTPLNFTTLVSLAAADYLQVQVYQASGGALDFLSTADWSPRFWLVKVG
jgi:hypothetical protein